MTMEARALIELDRMLKTGIAEAKAIRNVRVVLTILRSQLNEERDAATEFRHRIRSTVEGSWNAACKRQKELI